MRRCRMPSRRQKLRPRPSRIRWDPEGLCLVPSLHHGLAPNLLPMLFVHAAVQQRWAAARGLSSCVELGILLLESSQDSPGSQQALVFQGNGTGA